MTNILQIRLEQIKYGDYVLWMGKEIDSKSLFMTFTAIETILNYRPNSAREKVNSKKLKDLLGKNFQLGKKSAKVVNKPDGFVFPDNGKVSVISFEGFLQLVQWEVIEKNPIAINLVMTGLSDSLRSLALEQFGEAAEAEERQRWVKNRMATKDAFFDLGSAIKSYVQSHLEKSEKYRNFVYSNCQDALNRKLFGKAAKTIREELKLDNSDELLRDHYGRKSLRQIEAVQNLACRYIAKLDVEPLEAVKKALNEFSYSVIDYKN